MLKKVKQEFIVKVSLCSALMSNHSIHQHRFYFLLNSPTGDKYTKAREWGIFCVNAKWLGDIVTSMHLLLSTNVNQKKLHKLKLLCIFRMFFSVDFLLIFVLFKMKSCTFDLAHLPVYMYTPWSFCNSKSFVKAQFLEDKTLMSLADPSYFDRDYVTKYICAVDSG